jgi:hypothetical protein
LKAVRIVERQDAGTSAALSDARVTAAWALRLTLGLEGGDPIAAPWREILGFALAERCAIVAWRRSGTLIRRYAPDDVVVSWRSAVVSADVAGRLQLRYLAEVVHALAAEGIRCVVIKGIPLSQRLYGDPYARAVTDADLYIEPDARTRARTVLERAGWRHVEGVAPLEEDFERTEEGDRLLLEVQSSLLSDRLDHLERLDVEAEAVAVDGYQFNAHAGPGQLVHLATHLAKHQMAPLLWYADFLALWESSSLADQASAEALASRHGLDRYLQWALLRASALPRVAVGDLNALATIGVSATGRRDAHGIWRDVMLAPSLGAAVLAAADWVWPRKLRRPGDAFFPQAAHRLRARWRNIVSSRQRYEGIS